MINVLRSQFKGKFDIRHNIEPNTNGVFGRYLKRELPSVIMERQHPLHFIQLLPLSLGTIPNVPEGDNSKLEKFISKLIWKRDNMLQSKDADIKREMMKTIRSVDFDNAVIRKGILVDMILNNGDSNSIYDEWKSVDWDFDTPYLLGLMVCFNPFGFDKQNQYLWINEYLECKRRRKSETKIDTTETKGELRSPIDMLNKDLAFVQRSDDCKLLECDSNAFEILDSLLYRGYYHYNCTDTKIDWRVDTYNEIQEALAVNDVKRAIEAVELAFYDHNVKTTKALQYCIEEGYHMWYYQTGTIKACKLKHDWQWVWDNYYKHNHNIGGLRLRNRVKGIIDMYK